LNSMRVAVFIPLLLFACVSILGISWGLPSRKIDKYLFGTGEVWSGEKIYRLAKAGEKLSPERASRTGADVDVDPIRRNPNPLPSPQPSPWNGEGDRPSPQPAPPKGEGDVIPGAHRPGEAILLTVTDEDIAKIYLRYRLYTYQPDEMIIMMALAGMRPGCLQLDPRLYQYGGLFIYPVGALIKLCGLFGLIDVRSDVVYYLDHPDEFGKFYVVARAYSAAWGLLGVILVCAIARRMMLEPERGTEARRHEGTKGAPSADACPGRARAPGSNWLRSPNHQITKSPNRQIAPLPYGRGTDSARLAGLLAALLFTLMPVVVCMSHEGKPHLPGAVLMLAAVYFAMRCMRAPNAKFKVQSSKIEVQNLESATRNRQSILTNGVGNNRQSFWLMCVCCGAAVGMVLSSWPICVLIPLVEWLRATPAPLTPGKTKLEVRSGKIEKNMGRRLRLLSSHFSLHYSMLGLLVAVAVYFITNPYVLINAFVNRDVLRSNFGNSLAMYQIARIGEGFVRVLELTIEGATLPVLVLGVMALMIALARRSRRSDPAVWVLVAPAIVFFLQFVAIGAGKPAEYGRFGIFPNTALAIGAACLLSGRWLGVHRMLRWAFPAFVVASVAVLGCGYLRNFHADTTNQASRIVLADRIAARDIDRPVGLFAEPAPYSCPPLNFARREVFLLQSTAGVAKPDSQRPWIKIVATDAESARPSDIANLPLGASDLRELLNRPTPISWANKTFRVSTSDALQNPD